MAYAVLATIDFCYGHRILGHDGPCRHLHGHNARVEIVVSRAALDPLGMVCDFRTVKQAMKQWIDTHLDHRMVLATNDPLVPLLQQHQEPLYLLATPPTAETLAYELFTQARALGLSVTEVRLWETPSSCAMYRAGAD
ncbi:MAG: 6-carboxytetrahydropterin synthase [Deltaproteobacteria bacterium]|nr:6-carboxytetrahydropterin synthase [Deltaproteobacteria bacterium]